MKIGALLPKLSWK